MIRPSVSTSNPAAGPVRSRAAENDIDAASRWRWVRHKQWLVVVCVQLLVVGCAGLAGVSVMHAGSAATADVVHEELETFTDDAAGFVISYPRSWRVRASGDGAVLLHIEGQNAVSVRRTDLEQAVDSTNIANLRAVTDAVLSRPDAQLRVLDTREVEVDRRPGIYYLYYFPSGNQVGVHAHYFLFRGRSMYTLVFQIVPAEDFSQYAEDLDRVAASFQIRGR